MKSVTFLIQTLSLAGFHSPPEDTQISPSEPVPTTPTTRIEERLRLERPFTLAAHRSHSSHRSHMSHRSSYGGLAPQTSPAPVIPRYAPPPAVPPATPLSPPAEEPRVTPLPPGDTRNRQGTAPSSILPQSPSMAPGVQEQLKGNTRAFKALVYRVQVALFALDYYSGPIDGVIGPHTKAAISLFQRSYNLHVSGTIDDELLDALNIRPD
jgi:His-Xaa-Ser repeat protein HxsA